MSLFQILAREDRGGILGWSIGLGIFCLIVGLSYAAIKDDPTIDELFESFPEGLQEAFGGAQSLTSPGGYFESQITSLLPLLLGTYLVLLCTNRFAGAEEEGMFDWVLALPVTRSHFFLSRTGLTGAILIGILVTSGLVASISYLLVGVRGSDAWIPLAQLIDTLPIHLFLVGVGTVAGTLFHAKGPARLLGLGVLFGFYALYLIGQLVDGAAFLREQPFGWWAASDLASGDPGLLNWLVTPLLAVGLLALAYGQFQRKDLQA